MAAAHKESGKARILIVDDHPLVRAGLQKLIGQQSDLTCCGEAGSASEAKTAVALHQPDLVILDLRMKSADGLELIKEFRAIQSDVRILVLSQYDAPMYVERALRAGAFGYVVKEQAASEVLQAVRTVLSGEVYLTGGMAALLLGKMVGPKPNSGESGVDELTDRELHVFQLIGSGLSTREIAGQLNLSIKTIETHRENIKRKLNLRGASELVHSATQWASRRVTVSGTAFRRAREAAEDKVA
jgi:DNA-binding NarL/FixJ family response regulator